MTKGKRLQVYFTGRVQGVGFRYKVAEIANLLNLNGSVRNCQNGTVELIAEGTNDRLNKLLQSIHSSRLGHYITNEQISWFDSANEFDSFRISY